MSTVISRTLRAVPYRSALATWQFVVDILTAVGAADARDTLGSVAGIAAALITEKSPEQSPIVVFGGGPRVRIYCLYDDAAIEGDGNSEAPLSFNPFESDWYLSLPCPAADLGWVSAALAEKTPRVRARDVAEGITVATPTVATALELSVEEFRKS